MEELIVETKEEKKPKKRGRKPKKKGYFLEEQEEAFRNFLTCTNEREKNKIFSTKIYPALCKMIECLIRRYYLFSVNETYEDTFYETLSFLITKINNFDPDKGCKAYSYCGTVCKRYLILKRTKSLKEREKLLSYENVFSNPEKDNRVEEAYDTENLPTRLIEKTKEDIREILEVGCNEKRKLTPNEIKLGNALLEILDHWEEMIDDGRSRKFAKVSMLYFIKEYTLCSTTEVRNAMKIYKNIYLFRKQKLINE